MESEKVKLLSSFPPLPAAAASAVQDPALDKMIAYWQSLSDAELMSAHAIYIDMYGREITSRQRDMFALGEIYSYAAACECVCKERNLLPWNREE